MKESTKLIIMFLIGMICGMSLRGLIDIWHNQPEKHGNSIIETSSKSAAETKKSKQLDDKLTPIIEVKEKAAATKITHASQTLKQNEINISYSLSQPDSIKMHIADSLFTRR